MNPWAKSVIGGFNWGGAQPAPAKPDDDEKEDEKDAPRPAAQRQPQVARAPAVRAPQPNMFQEHAAMQQDMYAATSAAWANELASRKKQAEAERDRQHEYELEMLRQQGAAQRAQAAPEGGYGSPPSDAARQARNRALLGMAGLGGYRIQNGKRTPHPYQSPLARSLLG